MRILHVHKYYHDHDGAGRYMFEAMRLEEEAGHVVAPFAMHDPRNKPSVWDKFFVSSLDTSHLGFGIDGVRQAARALWSLEAKRKMTAMLDAFRPDVVHVHNIYTHLSPSILAACRAHHVPVVMTVHDYALVSANYGIWDAESLSSLEPRANLLTIAQSRFIKNSFVATAVLELIYRVQKKLRLYDRAIDLYLPSSEFMKRTLVQAGYAEQKMRVTVLPTSEQTASCSTRPPLTISPDLIAACNILPPLTISPEQTASCSTRPPLTISPLSKGEGQPECKREGVMFAGRLESYKGIDLFLQAASAFPNVKFFVAGTGPREQDVLDAMHRYPNLSYLGFLSGPELWAKMAAAELVIVPSRWNEPFGLVALEAMACGTPVLVSDAGGLPEKIKDGVNGLIFKSGNIQDLTSKLKNVLKHPADLSRLGEAGRRYVKVHADPHKHIQALLAIYTDLVIHM